MRKKILIISAALVVILATYITYLFYRVQSSDDKYPAEQSYAEQETPEFRDMINMHKWLKHKKHHVYYQLGIPYAANPTHPELEKMAIFVPSKFMKCKRNVRGETYTCEPNADKRIDMLRSTNAPIVMPIETPDYASMPALHQYRDVSKFTNAGLVYIHAGCRGIEQAAPACVADLKAAIRFIRHNKNNIPADTESIYVFGQGHGGGLAAILGASGNSKLYQPYLKEIGALLSGSDAVHGVMAWSPITGLESANEAYEWNMGYTRKGISQNQHELSNRLARAYADYVNNAGFRNDRDISLRLQYSERGIYQSGTYYDYIMQTIQDSASHFFKKTPFPYTPQRHQYKFGDFSKNEQPVVGELDPQGTFLTRRQYLRYLNSKRKWVRFDFLENKAIIRSVDDFIQSFKPATKPIAAFDAINRQQLENKLFRTDDGQNRHFDEWTMKILQNHPKAKEFADDLIATDRLGVTVAQRRNMYSPLYYMLPSSAGYRSAEVAPTWRIHSDINQTATALTSEANLFLAAERYPTAIDVHKHAEFIAIWAAENIMPEDQNVEPMDALIAWIRGFYNF